MVLLKEIRSIIFGPQSQKSFFSHYLVALIIVKFTRHNIKSAIIRKKKVLREAGNDVKIQEDLTHGRLDESKELNSMDN